jgi:hypothetical protein
MSHLVGLIVKDYFDNKKGYSSDGLCVPGIALGCKGSIIALAGVVSRCVYLDYGLARVDFSP